MTNSSWKITTYENGRPAASTDGLSHEQAIAAAREAMGGSDPLAEDSSFGRVLSAAEGQPRRQASDLRVPVAA